MTVRNIPLNLGIGNTLTDGASSAPLELGVIETVKEKSCTSCKATKTSKWVQDPKDKTKNLCNKCYRKALAQLQSALGKVCSRGDCKTNSTSAWHKDPEDKTKDVCLGCYRKALAQLQSALGKVCSRGDCKTNLTLAWHKDPEDKTKDVCLGCYRKALGQLQIASGKICSRGDCTNRWILRFIKDPEDKTKDVCQNCYQKIYKALKTRGVPNKCENLRDKNSYNLQVIVSSDSASSILSHPTETELTATQVLSSCFQKVPFTPVAIKQEPIDEIDMSPHIQEHLINNFLPILQDQNDSSVSLLLEEEGNIGSIRSVQWAPELSGLTKQQKDQIRQEMRQWLRLNEYNREEYAAKLNQLYEISTPIELGPDRGRSVYAKKGIKKYEVIGPYSGRLHKDPKSLDATIDKEGSYSVLSYLFGTRAQSRTISAFNTGNTMSLVNTGNLVNEKPWASNNVVSVCFGKNLIFYIALKNIKAGEELLLDYGPDYNPI